MKAIVQQPAWEMNATGIWRADLHVHTRFSRDSLSEPAGVVARARAIGLDRIAITDHDSIQGALLARRLDPDLVIVGEEISTGDGGELIAYFLTAELPAGLPLAEALRRLRDQGAVISISHPLDRWRRSAMGEKLTLQIIEQVDALEAFNARCLSSADNARTVTLAARYGKLVTAGSDAHTLGELGAGYVALPAFECSAPALLASLAEAQPAGRLTGLWPHVASTYARRASRRPRCDFRQVGR